MRRKTLRVLMVSLPLLGVLAIFRYTSQEGEYKDIPSNLGEGWTKRSSSDRPDSILNRAIVGPTEQPDVDAPAARVSGELSITRSPPRLEDCIDPRSGSVNEDCVRECFLSASDYQLLFDLFMNHWPPYAQYLSDENKARILSAGLIAVPVEDAVSALLMMVNASAQDREAFTLGMSAYERALSRMDRLALEALTLERFWAGGNEAIYILQTLVDSEQVSQALMVCAANLNDSTERRAAALAAFCSTGSSDEQVTILLQGILAPASLTAESKGSLLIENALFFAVEQYLLNPEGSMRWYLESILQHSFHSGAASETLRQALGRSLDSDRLIFPLLNG